ncbi:MAG TPA: hydroxymethylglutaryl-CoA reductase, degradative [Polyangia bacterium]|jgi:hydroxymethylglutaryl-CoA reductase
MSTTERTMSLSSRIPGFYQLPLAERRAVVARLAALAPGEVAALDGGIDAATADHVIENVVGTYALPLGIALNFQVNGRDYLVPMCVEEPSVVAAASNAARMVREGGGFVAEADDPIMIAQVQLVEVADPAAATAAIEAHAGEIQRDADATQPDLVGRGGGCRGLAVRPVAELLVVHLHVDCRDAMGANMVNTMAEAVAPRLAELAGGRAHLRILSNLADRRTVRVRARVPLGALAPAGQGAAVRDGIVLASRFAEVDPYRAATHNKGIMNGVDPVIIATGNDWRGVEAGAHAFAARSGQYGPLATWRAAGDAPDADLTGAIELPLALGTVGGTLRAHPGARLALKLLGVGSAVELAMVAAAAGLASNLAALRALATDGIQRGHMTLHARSVALAAGAAADEVAAVAQAMVTARDVSPARAEAELARLRGPTLGGRRES